MKRRKILTGPSTTVDPVSRGYAPGVKVTKLPPGPREKTFYQRGIKEVNYNEWKRMGAPKIKRRQAAEWERKHFGKLLPPN
jgi:hypothetical protein